VELPLDELAHKYGLPKPVVMDVAETAIANSLTKTFRSPVTCRMDGNRLRLIAYLGSNDPKAVELKTISKKLRRDIAYTVELELQKRQTLYEFHSMRELQGQVIKATISRIADNHTLYAMLEINDLLNPVILLGECSLINQPPHERCRYRVGESRTFFVSSVRPVAGRSYARVRIMLSRISRELPARMLGQLSGVDGIKCPRRVAGGFCEIVTPRRIPKSAINTVGKELREHVQVFIKKTS
jgi:hypothetical protein